MRLTLLVGVLFSMMNAFASEKPRVFIEESETWEIRGGFYGHSTGSASGYLSNGVGQFSSSTKSRSRGWQVGGSRPQTAELMKNFSEKCPAVVVTNRADLADFVVLFDREGGKGILRRDNKIAVFNGLGDLLFSTSTVTVGNAVKDACTAITESGWEARANAAMFGHSSAAAIPGAGPIESYRKGDDVDGVLWIRLPQEQKRLFLLGMQAQGSHLLEALDRLVVEAKPQLSPLLAASSVESQRASQSLESTTNTIEATIEESPAMSGTVENLIPRLDDFYSESRNLQIPVREALAGM